MDLGLQGKKALVCGSTSGLGLAVAYALAREGCDVALNGRDEDRLASAVEKLRRETDVQILGLAADVSRPEEAQELVTRAHDGLGQVDVLLTNAGGPPALSFADAPGDAWQEAIDLNLLSTIQLCRAAVPAMRDRGWGRVIMLTSVAAKQPLGTLILSTTARAGVLGFAKALADETAAHGVTVNVVCPGYMRTERVEELIERLAEQRGESTEAVREGMVADIPMGRIGDPDELGALTAFLASEQAGYITGTALQIDGGLVRSIV